MGRLFWKFFFFIAIAQITATFGVGVLFWVENLERSNRNSEIDLSPPASFMIRSAAATLQFGGTEALRSLINEGRPHRLQLYALDEDNKDLMGREVSPKLVEQAKHILATERERRVVERVKAPNGHSYLMFIPAPNDEFGPGGPPGGAREPHRIGERGPKSMFFPTMPIVVALLASLVFALLLAWYFSHPIGHLKNAFNQAANGNLDLELEPVMSARNDELADLGRDFDVMTAKLRTLMESQRRLLHDVSHELRSPIARLQVAIGLARVQDKDKLDLTLERIERESVRMDKLVGELLTLSRLEANVPGSMEEPIAIEAMLGDMINDASFEAEAIGKHVDDQLDCRVQVKGNPELLYRAIENVLRNAIKHTAPGTTVQIHTQLDEINKLLHLSILDRGPGVPEEEMNSIFELFFRSSRTKSNSSGHGLGLSIARRIVEAHQGFIQAANRSNGGLRVDITLPFMADEPARGDTVES
ncbi:HAMP domain-containing protein [Herbaspirillum seropedicae]|uniref:histidine kinase n=1 Tax=Herbaspirillum seropedicae (strain SmR1) TaxID=757424 RepID=D8IU36_HERSS|nr:ATP-binding protein [Herbaspirillum seropedicae]ADJ63698.1 two component sensor histidine kinase protein [Herbaspirillum seropedicae SmR1]AKN65718.1 histidine kinase [Herbaspirillum seropedicae]AON54525.1 two component sensor histidine kinase [Herbaspirillum seropedicae]MDR6394428.1 signal transduction histidine kinase [Herbaspirillum seropedicae]NQE28873.1 histidine kinase [Herbaspirillum seropedicae]